MKIDIGGLLFPRRCQRIRPNSESLVRSCPLSVPVQLALVNSHQIRSLVSVGDSIPRSTDFVFHVLPLLLLIWTSGGSVRCCNMGHRLYRRPSSDAGSMVISKIYISMVMGHGRFRHPLLCPESNLGDLSLDLGSHI